MRFFSENWLIAITPFFEVVKIINIIIPNFLGKEKGISICVSGNPKLLFLALNCEQIPSMSLAFTILVNFFESQVQFSFSPK